MNLNHMLWFKVAKEMFKTTLANSLYMNCIAQLFHPWAQQFTTNVSIFTLSLDIMQWFCILYTKCPTERTLMY